MPDDPRHTTAAISLRGVVKRFGAITAVDGLDLEVPRRRLLRPARPQRRGQVDDDAHAHRAGARRRGRDRRCSAIELPRAVQAGAHGDGRRAAAGQPRRRADLPPDPDGVRAPLPRRARRAPRRRSSGRSRSPTSAARADTIVRELSGGMRRRLLVARGLIHEPRLVLLDEPTVGLDPQVRQELWSLIDGLRDARRDGADVDPLHRGGRAPGRHRGGDVGAGGSSPRARPRELVARARRRAGARGLRAAARGWPRSSRARGAQRLGQPPQRPRGGDPARGDARRRGARRRARARPTSRTRSSR